MPATKRILALYAHPDDETFSAGGTLARYGREGTRVELVCATRGEEGAIADPLLADRDSLATVREMELRCAARSLNIDQLHFLDYRDSGMAGTPANQNADAFINAPAAEVVARLVPIIRALQPQVAITFEPWGGYGHPDHIAIHRHSLAALDAAADPEYGHELGRPWATPRLFYALLPTFLFNHMHKLMAARGLDTSFFDSGGFMERVRQGWPDDNIHYIIGVSDTLENKWAAFDCHRTQIGAENLFRQLPRDEMSMIFAQEYFAQARPQPRTGPIQHDLFAGLPL